MDRNAIRVERSNGKQLGYLSEELASAYAAVMDAGIPVGAIVLQVSRGHETLGLNIRLTVGTRSPGRSGCLPTMMIIFAILVGAAWIVTR